MFKFKAFKALNIAVSQSQWIKLKLRRINNIGFMDSRFNFWFVEYYEQAISITINL